MNIGMVNGEPYEFHDDEILVNTLIDGEPGMGKSAYAFRLIRHVMRTMLDVPVMLLDGTGTAADNLRLDWEQYIDEQPAPHRSRLEKRVLTVTLEPNDQSGVSFDLLKLRTVHLPNGRTRMETVEERVAAIMANEAAMRADSEVFANVHRFGKAAFTVLVAAHRKVPDLPLLLDQFSGRDYLAELAKQAERHHEVDGRMPRQRRAIDAAIRKLDAAFQTIKSNGALYNTLLGSTLTHFEWMTTLPLFCEPETVDYASHHDAGCVLLVKTRHPDSTLAAQARAALFCMRESHIELRYVDRPSLVVVDEKSNTNLTLFFDPTAKSRNRKNAHYYILQSPQQVGKGKDDYQQLRDIVQTKVHFPTANLEYARQLAALAGWSKLDALYLDTLSLADARGTSSGMTDTEGETESSGRSEDPESTSRRITDGAMADYTIREAVEKYNSGSGWMRQRAITSSDQETKTVTRGKERISLTEQDHMHGQRLTTNSTGTALLFPYKKSPVLAQCAYDGEPFIKGVSERLLFNLTGAQCGRLEAKRPSIQLPLFVPRANPPKQAKKQGGKTPEDPIGDVRRPDAVDRNGKGKG